MHFAQGQRCSNADAGFYLMRMTIDVDANLSVGNEIGIRVAMEG